MARTIIFLFLFSLFPAQAQEKKTVSHTIYATGNIGYGEHQSEVLNVLGKLSQQDVNATLLFLGNNVSSSGFDKTNDVSVKRLDIQLSLLKNFKGNIFFIPGSTDWKKGTEGLKQEQDHLNKTFSDKSVFFPKDGCPLKKVVIDNTIDLLLIDSEWALMDWDKFPDLNGECDIKSKAAFYNEIESQIVKSQNKTVLVALCHPPISYGKYNNAFSFGIDPQEINNRYYKEFSDRLTTIAQRFKNIIFVAGHETNLQYVNEGEVAVIISGSAATGGKVKSGFGSRFSSDDEGFAKITSYTDGSLELDFYGTANKFASPLFKTELLAPYSQPQLKEYNEKDTPAYIYRSIYEPEELKHSNLYTSLWGAHYREDYVTPVKIRAALLDTLYGGLEVLRKGGGHQTNSLRLKDHQGKEYSMRNVKKSSLRFIQYFLFKTQYLNPDLNDTYFVQLLQDYWTTANPYASLTIADLSDAVNILHANPELYYVPKQGALGIYNDDYGDKVYYIEEQISDGLGSIASLGYHDKIIGSTDLAEELERKDKISVNESLYIRTRLFDNILGDFDRHADQWRWAEDKLDDGTVLYSPIPRDRDQAYSDFDGPILGILRTLAPSMRFMQRYNGNFKGIRWFNDAGDDLDRLVLRNDTEADWVREAKYIKEHLTNDIVEKAFSKIPDGVNTKKKDEVKQALIERISGIEEHSHNLYRYLKSFVTITGTEKDDWFVVDRLPNGDTHIQGFRIKDGKKSTLFWDAQYNSKITKEIWIYGLDDKDIFEIMGKGKNLIPIKIIGGKGNDTYRVANTHKVHIYDQRSKPNIFETKVRKTLTDNYSVNNYDFMKGRKDLYTTLPSISYNPDDGVALGAIFNYTKNDLVRNPFTAQHILSSLYYTATGGVNIGYKGEFAHVIRDLNIGIDAGFTTANYTNNFFGLGNHTASNNDMEYNRVRIRQRWISPSLIYKGYYGSRFQASIKYENIEVENTPGRYINVIGTNPYLFNGQDVYGIRLGYSYSNFDALSFPGKGVGLGIITGYTANFSKEKGFAYITPEFRVTTKINRKGTLVAATKMKANYIFNNDFEFYQAATLGGNEGLRGFRTERFSGRSSYYQSTDLRLSLGRLKNGILPLSFGIYGGFDYGRVWIDHERSDKWHTSQGGGVFFNIAGLTTANVAYFNSTDGGRLNIRFELAF